MASFYDVARDARVSIATVSRVFREPDVVRATTRARVLEAATLLRYHPNLIAASLASNRSSVVGLILPNVENPFYCGIYAAVARIAQQQGRELFLKTTCFESERMATVVRQMIERRAASVMLWGGSFKEPLLSELKDEQIRTAAAPKVEYARAIQSLLQYLSDLGHRRVGIVEHRTTLEDSRLSAMRKAMRRFPQLKFRTTVNSDTLAGGQLGCRELLAAGDLTALVCTHDITAVGALREAREQGLRVPQDLSIAGFDNIALANFCTPLLTTINVEAGSIAAAMWASCSGEGKPQSIDCSLIVRDSTAAAIRRDR